MARPGIGWIGIEQAIDLIQQCRIGALARVVLVQDCRDGRGIHRIDHGAASDGVGAIADLHQVGRKPVWCDLAIRVGAKQDALGWRPSCRVFQGHSTGLPSISTLGRELVFNDVQWIA